MSDFRSDTVTKPTPAMREAAFAAGLGDDVLDGDPTVRDLEEFAADWLGKDGALFVPSGTMANQVSLGALTRPGDEIVCDAGAHCISFESGALAALWGAQARTIAADRGLLDPAAVEAMIRPQADVYPRTRVVEIENTHNRAGGVIFPQDEAVRICEAAAAHNIATFLDGARIWNVAVACERVGLRRDDVDVRVLPHLGILRRLRPPESSERPAAANIEPGGKALLAGALAVLGLPPAAGVLTLPVVWELA